MVQLDYELDRRLFEDGEFDRWTQQELAGEPLTEIERTHCVVAQDLSSGDTYALRGAEGFKLFMQMFEERDELLRPFHLAFVGCRSASEVERLAAMVANTPKPSMP